jgi:hypothetical protein
MCPPENADPDEVAAPVLFNLWKHHAGAVRRQIRKAAAAGPDALAPLARELVVIGADLMDFYVGRLEPCALAGWILQELESLGKVDYERYRTWIGDKRGYRELTVAEDSSRWVLRLGQDPARYLHLHPGRWSPCTLRVRANVLKTAVLAIVVAAQQGVDPHDTRLINSVRQQYLSLPPVRGLEADQGLARVIDLLARDEVESSTAALSTEERP